VIRRLPVIPTIVVAAAVALMIGLGIWQLQRARWKEGLLTRYAEAEKLPPIAFPTAPIRNAQLPLFRHATGVCLAVAGKRAVAGENRAGEPGYVQIVDCVTGAEGPGMRNRTSPTPVATIPTRMQQTIHGNTRREPLPRPVDPLVMRPW